MCSQRALYKYNAAAVFGCCLRMSFYHPLFCCNRHEVFCSSATFAAKEACGSAECDMPSYLARGPFNVGRDFGQHIKINMRAVWSLKLTLYDHVTLCRVPLSETYLVYSCKSNSKQGWPPVCSHNFVSKDLVWLVAYHVGTLIAKQNHSTMVYSIAKKIKSF